MSFNKNASKRLSVIAGINRESREIADIINSIVHEYLTKTLGNAIKVVLFSGRKTLIVDDLRFLSRICPDYPQVACPTNLAKLAKVCIESKDIEAVLRGYKGYSLYTLKRPFNNLVRGLAHELCRADIRIGKNVIPLLQNMTEHQIIKIMNQAATYTIRDNRDTLLPKDIETALRTM
uniref:Histone-like protein n=1 Tax=Marseillevirus LCMAC202 TaxID=2506606 RepID=A0A481Z0D2_9VIRU|nr:MAG: histone-like protein [Marseillevirus LCMAC202]